MEEKKGNQWLWFVTDWGLSREELERQLAEYKTLGWTKSCRKMAATMMMLATALTLILTFYRYSSAQIDGLDAALRAAFTVLIYGTLAWLLYRGYRWAIVLTMLAWTGEKLYQLVSGAPPILVILYWIIFMQVFVKAYVVAAE